MTAAQHPDGAGAGQDARVFTPVQRGSLTIFGLAILVLVAASVSAALALGAYVLGTALWLVLLTCWPSGPVRRAARERGELATVGWMWLVVPFVIGAVVWGIVEVVASSGL